jgi:hypothetical protein
MHIPSLNAREKTTWPGPRKPGAVPGVIFPLPAWKEASIIFAINILSNTYKLFL